MLRHLTLALSATLFCISCSDSGPFSSESDKNGSDINLSDFSKVNSTHNKVASESQVIEMAGMARIIRLLESQMISSKSLSELRRISSFSSLPSSNDSLMDELEDKLNNCQKDTATDQAGAVENIGYSFISEDNCKFIIKGFLERKSGPIGRGSPSVPAPNETRVNETFTLNNKSEDTKSLFSEVSLTKSYHKIVRANSERGKTSETKELHSLSGKLTLSTGEEISFTLIKANQDLSTRISDSRYDSTTTQDFRGNVNLPEGNMYYEDFSQRLPNQEEKAKEYEILNGVVVERVPLVDRLPETAPKPEPEPAHETPIEEEPENQESEVNDNGSQFQAPFPEDTDQDEGNDGNKTDENL